MIERILQVLAEKEQRCKALYEEEQRYGTTKSKDIAWGSYKEALEISGLIRDILTPDYKHES